MLLYLIGGDTITWRREDYSQRQSKRQDGGCTLTNTMTGVRDGVYKSAGGAEWQGRRLTRGESINPVTAGGGWTARCKARPHSRRKQNKERARPQNCRGCTNQLCWRDCSFTPHSHVVRSNHLLEGRSPDQSPIDIYECPESGFCSWFQTSNGYSRGCCNHEMT